MKATAQVINKINLEKLREQKSSLLHAIGEIEESEAEKLCGLLHLIDSIQDSLVEDGIATEEEVFGNLEIEGYENN